MQPSSDKSTPDRSRALKRYGPLAIVAVIVLVIVVVAVTRGGGDDESATDAEDVEAPEGAISFQQAQEENLDVTFPDTCDTERGTVAIPYDLAAPCFADAEPTEGYEPPQGVTEDSIKVVVYLAQDDDPILNLITGPINVEDTNEEESQTYQAYTDMFNEYYQTYGRQVELEFMTASGTSLDEVSARADAVRADEEFGAFAVWGGPVLTQAFADELAARGIVCLACEIGSTPEFYEERAPYIYHPAQNADQVRIHAAEYISKRLAGQPAEHAGDPALQDQERTFGYVWIENQESAQEEADAFVAQLSDQGLEVAQNIPYDLTRLQEQATSIITQLKDAGVTSVIFSGDPIAPATLTQEATAQNYFPEWILGPNALVDTTVFSRIYDQRQWAHAFGPTAIAARVEPTQVSAWQLHQWYTGQEPPAEDTNQVFFPQPALFFSGLQAAGPNLTPETFRAGLFSREPTPQALTSPSLSFGDHGRWPYDDYNGTDDMAEIWWDPEATGPDEIRREGQGMWRYSEGGRRFLPGEWTEEDRLFVQEDSVTVYEERPPEEAPPDYPSPAGGG